jgi:hypothetical protein
VEGVWTIILFSVVGNVVEGIFAISNAIDVASRNCIVDGMSRVDGCNMLSNARSSARRWAYGSKRYCRSLELYLALDPSDL